MRDTVEAIKQRREQRGNSGNSNYDHNVGSKRDRDAYGDRNDTYGGRDNSYRDSRDDRGRDRSRNRDNRCVWFS